MINEALLDLLRREKEDKDSEFSTATELKVYFWK
jgi:hypothetical protein